jgi:tetratricopeptide (TPR) repeat protein
MRLRPKAIFVIISILAAVFLSNGSFASGGEEEIKKEMLVGQELILKRHYPEALKIFEKIKLQYPDSPSGCFGEMAVYEVQMLEREDLHLERELKKAADEGLGRISILLQRYNPSAWDLFISGAIYGLDGFFKARKGQWWDAYVMGNKSRQLFKRVKEIDPSYLDADFGLGMYLYWRSVFTRDLWFLKFIPNKRDEGLFIVKNVAENGRFAKDMAGINLGLAYLEEGMYRDAGQIFASYVERYPENVILRKLLGKVLTAEGKYDAAITQFREILNIDKKSVKAHYFLGATLVLKADPQYYADAERELRHFLKAQKGAYWPAAAHYWLGRLAELRGDKKTADLEYATARKLNPKLDEAIKRVRGMGGGV